jgi:hypothetical protein
MSDKPSSGDKKLYEQRPFIYMGLGVITLAFGKSSRVALGSGILLILIGCYVYVLRKEYRKKMQNYVKKIRKF